MRLRYPRARRDSDIWAIYTRTCLGQSLEMSRKAALNVDVDIESTEKDHVQKARRAPATRGKR